MTLRHIRIFEEICQVSKACLASLACLAEKTNYNHFDIGGLR